MGVRMSDGGTFFVDAIVSAAGIAKYCAEWGCDYY